MSTFDGFVKEFPNIRIDYFRQISAHHRHPKLACFLSHVHSDHLQGLEAFRAPFIYCSAATREILLRIERRPARLNFAKGVLETRIVHYKHLKNLLKPIPLNTRTVIELSPETVLRVTLLDANHCPGSVMFLIEDECQAILYTGDVRAETWWVNSLVRNPSMIPFSSGLRRLDNLYLDTTFATKSDIYRSFPSKRDGIRELLEKISRYSKNTVFYFHSWTFGYEHVWITLAAVLESKIHVDDYKLGVYGSLARLPSSLASDEAASLCGFSLGNTYHAGCLTNDQNARLHACERGQGCAVLSKQGVVHIIPVVSRDREGSVIPEKGAGGGYSDLCHVPQLEFLNSADLDQLASMCSNVADPEQRAELLTAIQSNIKRGASLNLDDRNASDSSESQLQLKHLLEMIQDGQKEPSESDPGIVEEADNASLGDQELPRVIRFPYSRHSSYQELCELLDVFRPKDVHPCTVDAQNWHPGISMRTLFGHLCCDSIFAHDQDMLAAYQNRASERASDDLSNGLISGSPAREMADEPTPSPQATFAEAYQNIRGDVRDGTTPRDLDQGHHSTEIRPPKRLRHEGSRQPSPNVGRADFSQVSADSDGVPRMPSHSPQPYHTPQVNSSGMRSSGLLPAQANSVDAQNGVEKEASQNSLQDSAFGSQSSLQGAEGIVKLERRREAYKVAKGGDWANFSTVKAMKPPRHESRIEKRDH